MLEAVKDQEGQSWVLFETTKLYTIADVAARWGCTFREARMLVCDSGEDGQFMLASGEPLLDAGAIGAIERVVGDDLHHGRYQAAHAQLVERRISEMREAVDDWQRAAS